jgi:hypothetical protein
MKTKTVWIVEIILNDSIVAVGTRQAIALRNCAARALEYLENRDVLDDSGDHYTIESLIDYFGYRATECELNGAGERH